MLSVVRTGGYQVDGRFVDIAMAARDAESGTRVYSPAQVARLREDRGELALATVSVVDGSTQSVARQLAASGPVTLLNFASARNVGGGFINGAKAQEEDLCRCSALYPCLESCTDYYETNRNQSSMLYTDDRTVVMRPQ